MFAGLHDPYDPYSDTTSEVLHDVYEANWKLR